MLKESLHRRDIRLDDVLEICPDCAANARVFDVIQWAPFFGETKAKAAMKRLGEPEHRLLGHMTRERRRELVRVLARSNRKALWGAAHRDYLC